MKQIKPYLCFLTFSLTSLIPAFTEQLQAQLYPTRQTWQISQAFKPPKRGAPPASAAGATRSSSCLQGKNPLTSLLPPTKLGLTFAQYPTFFGYLPPSPAKTAEFIILADAGKRVHYETTLTLPNKPGIIGFSLPMKAPPLEKGKSYHWYLTIVCDSEDFSANPTIDGWVERIQPDPTLSTAIGKAKSRDLSTLYAEAGIWHEALTTLVQLRLREPNNSKINRDWKEFLKSVGLGAIASEPLINCCTAK